MVSEPCQRHDATGSERNGTMQVDVACLPANKTKGHIPSWSSASSQRNNERKELVCLVFDRRISLLICFSRLSKLTFVELGDLCLVLHGSASWGGETKSLADKLSPSKFISEDYVTVRLQKIYFP